MIFREVFKRTKGNDCLQSSSQRNVFFILIPILLLIHDEGFHDVHDEGFHDVHEILSDLPIIHANAVNLSSLVLILFVMFTLCIFSFLLQYSAQNVAFIIQFLKKLLFDLSPFSFRQE